MITDADRAEFIATIPDWVRWRIDIDNVTECFLATRGPRSGNHGHYPVVSVGGRSLLLHRWLWTQAHGDPGHLLVARPTCWDTLCVRLSHMQAMEWSELSLSWRKHHGNRSNQPRHDETTS